MRDVQDDDGASVLSDPVANTPVRPAAGRIRPGILIPQQVADAVRVLQQRASEEPGRGRSDRSRGAGVAEQMSEAAPELGLIQTRAFLPLPRLLT